MAMSPIHNIIIINSIHPFQWMRTRTINMYTLSLADERTHEPKLNTNII